MAYNALFRIYSTAAGTARITVDIKNTSSGEVNAGTLWYGTGFLQDGDDNDISFPWDSQNGRLSSSAPTSAVATIRKSTASSTDTATGNISLTYNRTAGTITLSSDAGLFATPVEYDVSDLEWSAAETNTEYSQLNAGGELSYEAVDHYTAPVITGLTNTAAQTLTAVWTASASSKTGANPTLTLQYSTDPTFSGALTKSLTGLSGSTAVASLTKATAYYFRIQAVWSTAGVTLYSNAVSGKTITPLGTPSINSLEAASGSGTAGWNAIDGADGYQWRSASTEAGLDSATASSSGISGTTLTFSGQSGKWIQVRAIAPSAQYATENSEWSEAKEIPAETISYNETRIDFAAIPSVNVDSEQIHLDNDVITKKYADDHYASTSSVNVTSLPAANGYGTKAANGGVVYLQNDSSGLTASSGKLTVNFAPYDTAKTITQNTTGLAGATKKAATPDFVGKAIAALSLGDAATKSVAANTGTNADEGKVPVLDGGGKLSINVMPARVIGGEYLGEVANENAMIAKTDATVGDFVKRTDKGTYWMLGVEGASAYATASNWFEYAGAVTKVNGNIGDVT